MNVFFLKKVSVVSQFQFYSFVGVFVNYMHSWLLVSFSKVRLVDKRLLFLLYGVGCIKINCCCCAWLGFTLLFMYIYAYMKVWMCEGKLLPWGETGKFILFHFLSVYSHCYTSRYFVHTCYEILVECIKMDFYELMVMVSIKIRSLGMFVPRTLDTICSFPVCIMHYSRRWNVNNKWHLPMTKTKHANVDKE
jgi:hypothetical protein